MFIFLLQMDYPNKRCHDHNYDRDSEKTKVANHKFKLYFKMAKNNEMEWEHFINVLNSNCIWNLDLENSKNLIYDLLEEIRVFKEQETYYKDKLQMNKFEYLKQSKEIESLKKERDELRDDLQIKLSSFLDSKESNSKHLTFGPLGFKYFKTKMEIVKNNEIDIDKNMVSVSNEILRKENESLKKENHELQRKLSSLLVSNEIQENFPSNTKHHLKVIKVIKPKIANLNVPKSIKLKSRKCEICEKTFSSLQRLKTHRETKHKGQNLSEIKIKETNCNEIVHEGLKKYNCNKCGKYFGRAGDLKRHNKTIHEGLKNFKCHKCDKSFGQSYHLKRHQTVHEGQ